MVSLPNIISGKLIVPEIIQGNVNADNISYNIEKILYDTSYRENYIKSLKGVRELLSDKVSSKEAAKEISNELLLI